MCNEAPRREPATLKFVPENLQTQEMCKRVVEESPRLLKYVPDRFKTKEIYDKVVSYDPSSLQYVLDYFVVQQQLKIWHDDDYYCNDNELTKCYNGYRKCKAQETSIKEELMPIAWHPSRWWDWCIPGDEKKRARKIVGISMDLLVSCDQLQKFFERIFSVHKILILIFLFTVYLGSVIVQMVFPPKLKK